jgi:hypothetical protein
MGDTSSCDTTSGGSRVNYLWVEDYASLRFSSSSGSDTMLLSIEALSSPFLFDPLSSAAPAPSKASDESSSAAVDEAAPPFSVSSKRYSRSILT